MEKPNTNKQQERILEDLCRQAQAGDRLAESRLVGELLEPILAFVTRRVWEAGVAEDLRNATIEIVIRKVRKGHPADPAYIRRFAFGIARNMLRDHIRDRGRHAGWRDMEEQLIDDQEPLEKILDSETRQTVLNAVDRLSQERDQRALIDTYFRERSLSDVCRTLQVTRQHLHRILHRARQRLGRELQPMLEGR